VSKRSLLLSWCLGIVVTGAVALLGQSASEQVMPGLVDTVRPFKSFGHVYDSDSFESMRPRIMGTHGVIATGHYLATQAGFEILKAGGNAFDAGVTAAMALKVTKMGFAGWTGVAPLILYSAAEDRVITRVGAGTTPARATLQHFLDKGKRDVDLALVPADVDVWLAALERFGELSFEQAATPALEIAEGGYHLYKHQKWLLDSQQGRILKYPYNQTFWFQHGVSKQRIGDLMVNKDLGRLIRYMMTAERTVLARGGSRADGITAARDAFYKGEPAHAVDAFYEEQNGLITYDDLANYESSWMAPLHTTFRGYDVYVGDGWSQGPRLILFLNMLDQFDLESLGYNSADYIHLLSQVIALGMSDVHKHVGDPSVANTPATLYSKEYAAKRVMLIDREQAFSDMPPWGNPNSMLELSDDSPLTFSMPPAGRSGGGTERANETSLFDTSSLNVMDNEGNLFSMTESDGHMVTPMIPGWGFGLSRRMYQLNLDPNLANVMAPGKRPRNTNSPVLIMKAGKPFMGLSTPGGDQQLQSLLQVFLNVVIWGMSPEQALDQPRFGSYNFPPTGSEVNQSPGLLKLEGRIPEATFETLSTMGHNVESWGLWNWQACAPTVTYREPDTGLMIAAGDVRRETTALGF